ncbi:MAG: HPr family phosphocarrier protein [Chitinispirillaceae bacterium]|nr:HPr family phosphocarrier protein [Chitinispirillaceae bacterium]
MIERQVAVANEMGIHARPSSMIVQTAQKFKSDIVVVKNGAVADAKSIMSVMMLAATRGSMVTIRASGIDEADAVRAIAGLFEKKFDEQ